MAGIKDMSRISKKFVTNASNAGSAYQEGVENPKRDWAQATLAAEQAQKDGIQKAIQQGSFVKGVRKAGTNKWSKGAVEKGATRFGAGISMAQGAYEQGFAPYHQAIASATLPQRFAKRDPRNIERVKAVNNALIRVKESST